MTGRLRGVAAATAAAGLAAAGIAAAATEDFTVAGGAIGGAKANCAKGKLSTGGGYRSDPGSIWTQRAVGPSGRGFRVTLKNEDNVEQSGEAVALCANRDPFKKARKREEFTLDPATRAVEETLRARCPRGTELAGGGFSLRSPEAAEPYVHESRPANRAWKVHFTLQGTGDHVVKVRAVCDTRPGAEYKVEDAALSEQLRRGASRGLTTLLLFELNVNCKGAAKATAGGFASSGDFTPWWRTIAPVSGDFEFAGSDSPDPSPEGDIVGYAICRK